MNDLKVGIAGFGGGGSEIAAVGRLTRLRGSDEAETAILVSDSFQNRGLGTELLRRLTQFARKEKIHRISADSLADNQEMQQVCRKLGFRLHRPPDDTTVRAVLDL